VKLGAIACFDYNAADLAELVRAASGDDKIDVILDMSAGAHFTADLDMLAHGGRIAHLSAGGNRILPVPLQRVMAGQFWITGSLLRPLALEHKRVIARRIASEIWPLVGVRVRPVIAARYPLEEASAAHRELEKGRHIGKIMLAVEK
jgi:NADPH:quinone reductase-like Zn-dependent oxidoreductase